jgi:outer membrane protein assembly factor BamD
MIRRMLPVLLLLLLPLAACGRNAPPRADAGPVPVRPDAANASPAHVDSLWARAENLFRRGKWGDATTEFERLNLELPVGDPRVPRSRFYLAESNLQMGNHLQAAREFRRVSDDFPSDALAADALLRVADAYAELWRRPELDPSYGQTALAAYQELLSRYPGSDPARRAAMRVSELQEKFAEKEFKAAQYYLRLKAYDSAILYLKDIVATYPKTSVAPQALVRLVGAYRTIGYKEDVAETCRYIARFHAGAPGAKSACPEQMAPADSAHAPAPAPAAAPATPPASSGS